MQARYTSLPGAWPSESRKKLITVNNLQVPLVPLICTVLILIGLPMWAVGMLQARATTDTIFSDMGITDGSVDKLKASVLAVVLVLSPLVAVVLGLNIWLEASRPARPGQAETGLTLSSYTSSSTKVNAANWLLLLLLALLATAGSITWLTSMSGALSAVDGGGGGGGPPSPPFWPPAAAPAGPAAPAPAAPAVPAAPAAPAAPHQLLADMQQALEVVPAGQQGQQWYQRMQALLQAASKGAANEAIGVDSKTSNKLVGGGCPPGCVDLGIIASILGLPWNCFCQTWMLADLATQLHQVVQQLWVAVAGAVLMFVATTWLFGYLAAQGVHAERDLEELMKSGDGLVWGSAAAAVPAAGTGP